jgi:hypothetical protein
MHGINILERGSGNRTHHGPVGHANLVLQTRRSASSITPRMMMIKIEFRKQLDANERRFSQIGQEYNKDSVFKKNTFDL